MSIGNVKDYTPNFKFIIPSFDIATWHDYIEENFRNIDALFYNLFGINNYSGTWKKITSYTVGQVLFVGEDKDLGGNDTDYAGRLVKVLVDHTTDNSDYFNIYYNLHPEYYELFADASTAQYYAQIAQQNANITTNLRQETESLFNFTKDLRNDTQILRNDALLYRDNAETFANNAQVSAENALDYLNLTQEKYYNAVNEINSLSREHEIMSNDLLQQTQTAAQNAQDYAKEAWGKISNVGDIFYTLRLDDELNGAVECNGNFYELEDFTGTHSIKNLLEQNKLPYVSLAEYENTLNTYGSVRCFGYTPYEKSKLFIQTLVGGSVGYIYRSIENDTIINGNQMTAWLKDGQVVYTLVPEDQIPAYLLLNSVDVYSEYMGNLYKAIRYEAEQGSNQFRVPRLKDIYIKAGTANLPNEFNVESLPNITGAFHHNDLFSGTATASGAFGTTVAPNGSYAGALQDTRTTARWDFDASRSSSTYKNNAKVNPDNIRYRAMVQLANAATENAVISATSAISQLADAMYKSKNEIITGQKTIETTNEKILKLKANDINSNYIPLTDVTQGIVEFLDSNGINLGYLFAHNLSNGQQQIGFQAHRVVDGVDKYASINCGVNGSGEPYTSAITPANTSNSTSIATTAWVKSILSSSGNGLATFSKSGNGYIRFSNGIQICWGTVSTGSTATFAKAFSTIYSATLSMIVDDNGGYVAYVGSISTTQIKARRYNNNSGTSCRYIAIGIS